MISRYTSTKKLTTLLFLLLISFKSFGQSESKILFDFTQPNTIEDVKAKNVQLETSNEVLNITVNKNEEGLLVINGDWDLSDWIYLTLELRNNNNELVRFDPILTGEVKNKKWSNPLWSIGWLNPNETRLFNCVLLPDYSTRNSHYTQMHEDFPNMRGMPDGISFARSFDLKLTKQIKLKIPATESAKNLTLVSIKLNKPSRSKLYLENPEGFFPFIDEYGQYKHDTWRGKITSDKQFLQELLVEEQDLKNFKGSDEWNEFGGFENGPKHKATGHFRVEKIEGKWWIIDPSGALFWSNGVNSAGRLNVSTPYTGRAHFFEALPSKSDASYGKFYKGTEYHFGKANLLRKYGTDEEKPYVSRTLSRMKSWGLNTMGGWSHEGVISAPKEQKAPYTLSVGTTKIGINEKLPDVFDPEWETHVRNVIGNKAKRANKDPYFFGYFVDNEMHWYQPNSLVKGVIANKPTSAGKSEYIKQLKKSLKKIENFNTKANTNFKNWNALLENRKKLDLSAFEDLNIKYYEKFCHTYFSTIKKTINELSPGNLFLGCRWHIDGKHRNKYNVKIASEYLDILSFNQYDNELVDFTFPGSEHIDKPYIISEFNFGALDRGKFYPGLGHASDQRNRGEKYKNFVDSGLRNANCVGVHWFMWGNSTTAGRSVVGENANCGIVSEMDSPYYELISYMRQINYNLYNYRISN